MTQPQVTVEEAFTVFMRDAQPRVLVALAAAFGPEAANDASAEAFAYAWEHWDRVGGMDNPAGYVYRVGRSRVRPRKPVTVCPPPPVNPSPLVEPKLVSALGRLSARQRAAVVLTEGFGYSLSEVAELLGVHPSSVRRHRERALRKLRSGLGVRVDA
ncbi:MAG TPA: sigma-70 family RNA polymerase sigma factor [Acidimicrobiia bacterium]|nr:sigma-70 family RNA polymerase sigma factor [Acidimicrobiia bacterium]